MKKVISSALMIGGFAVAIASLPAHSHIGHMWSKVSEQKGVNGQVVCQWKCAAGGYGKEHHTTTSGYGSCGWP